MGISNSKKLRKHEDNFKSCALEFFTTGMDNPVIAKKLLNLRREIENLSSVGEFNIKLKSWNSPVNLFDVINDVIRKEENRKETCAALRGVVDTTITTDDYLAAVRFLEKAHNINAWADNLETMVDAFTMLRFIARSTKFGTEYMLDLQIRIQEEIWNEQGEFYSWSKTSVEHDRGDDYSSDLIEKWQSCYHEFLNQAYALYKVCKEHNEFLDLPRQILEEFTTLIKED